MPFKTGSVVHEEGGFSIAQFMERQRDGSYEFAGFSLIGTDIDPTLRYGSVEDAKQAIERLLGRSIAG